MGVKEQELFPQGVHFCRDSRGSWALGPPGKRTEVDEAPGAAQYREDETGVARQLDGDGDAGGGQSGWGDEMSVVWTCDDERAGGGGGGDNELDCDDEMGDGDGDGASTSEDNIDDGGMHPPPLHDMIEKKD